MAKKTKTLTEKPPPRLLPIVILMLIGLSGYMLWQFDPGLAKIGVPAALVLVFVLWMATKST